MATPPSELPPSPLREIGANLIDDPGLWMEEVITELTRLLKTFLPDLLGAFALLLVITAAAFVLRWLIHRFGKGLDAILAILYRWMGQKVPRPRWSFSSLVGDIAFWITLAYGVSAAAEQIGFVTFGNWVLELLGYLPRVLIGVFVLFLGYLVSNGVKGLILTASESESGGFQHGSSLAQLTSGLILAFALLLGLDQLGLDVELFTDIIVLAAAALFGSVALAFGIGAGDAVRNVIALHYVRRAYRTGQRVRAQGVEGEILEMTPVAVVVETTEGEAWIPARLFLEGVALVVEQE